MTKLKVISVKDEDTIFGTLLPAGTRVYDEEDGKMYLLTDYALGLECLSSILTKRELFTTTFALGIVADTGFWGYNLSSVIGTLSPTTFYSVTIDRMGTLTEGGNSFFVDFGEKVNDADSLSATIGTYGTVTLTWQTLESIYRINEAALATYIQNAVDTTISITLKF